MVEYMEKSVLRSRLACQLVNIVQYQYIYQLIEMQKIVDLILSYGFGKLCLKKIGRYI